MHQTAKLDSSHCAADMNVEPAGSWQEPRPKRYARLDVQREWPPNPRWAFFVNGATSGPERSSSCLGGRGRESQSHACVPPSAHRAQVASRMGAEQDLPRDRPRSLPAQALRPRHVPLPQRGRACTSAIPRATRPPTSSAATSGCAAINVLHPMGWDAFGLPAEQYAVQTSTHPRITTQNNIDTFRRQIKSLGFSLRLGPRGRYDRSRLLQVDAVDLPAALRHLVRPRFRVDRPAGPAGARARAGRSPSCRSRRATARSRRLSRLASGWPTRPRCPSTGARRWAPCWPTRR